MNTTRTAEGGPYRRQQLVFTPRQERVPFRTILLAQGVVNIPSPTGTTMPPGQGVRVSRVGPDDRPARQVYEPDHPDANAEGFVSYPDIDPVTEMADMLSATRAYEANVTALNAAKAMASKALEIGR
jgi:flagellar basal-body rod protein FlgC